MKRSAEILDRLQDEFGFVPELVGGREGVLAQIERILAHGPGAGSPGEADLTWEQLVAEIIVPETSFLRHPESFAALGALAATHPGRLRILCLPCSTGEEAYSIALTLLESGQADFRLTAGDAFTRSVAIARAGRYSPHRLRSLPEASRDRWFPGGNATDSLRATIDFREANIFTFAPDDGPYDAIFCRNLLIYFDAVKQERTFNQLAHWLAPGGVLFLGPGEATAAAAFGWRNTGQSMAFAFTRESRPAISSTPIPSRTRSRPRPRPRPTPSPAAIAAFSPPVDDLALATALANSGRLDASAAALARFHETRAPTAASLLLRGILDEAAGQLEAAETCYRKALYLDPDQLEALLHLSLLLESAGRTDAVRPLRRRIEQLTPPL